MNHSGVLGFTKVKQPPNRSLVCTGICKGKEIVGGQIFWKSGHDSLSKPRGLTDPHQPMRLCQLCFGFWLARYHFFDYNPFQIDKEDLKAKEYWNRDWEAKCMRAFFENMEVDQKVLLEVIVEKEVVVL